MEAQALDELRLAGLGASDVDFERSLTLCYPGQTFDMPVPAVLTDGRLAEGDLERSIDAFHDLHQELHSYAMRDEEPVVRGVRVQAVGRTPKPFRKGAAGSDRGAASGAAPVSRRPAWFGEQFLDTPVYDGDRLGPGQRLEGPAIVEEQFTTIVLAPGHRAELDAAGNYVVELG